MTINPLYLVIKSQPTHEVIRILLKVLELNIKVLTIIPIARFEYSMF